MRKADNNHHLVPLSRNLGNLTSWNPLGLSRPVMRMFYLYIALSLVLQARHCVFTERDELNLETQSRLVLFL